MCPPARVPITSAFPCPSAIQRPSAFHSARLLCLLCLQEELLQTSDVVNLHCALTDETRHIINEATLKLMKPTAILVNTARGGSVDMAAVKRALDAVRRQPPFCHQRLPLSPAFGNALRAPLCDAASDLSLSLSRCRLMSSRKHPEVRLNAVDRAAPLTCGIPSSLSGLHSLS